MRLAGKTALSTGATVGSGRAIAGDRLHIDASESVEVAAALAGDHAAFDRLTTRYRRELLVHCYGILGSVEDAEHVLQETMLRAWRRLASFEGRAPLRAWLYKIATHTAWNAVDSRRRRSLPTATHTPADPDAPLLAPNHEMLWLEPLPDALLAESAAAHEQTGVRPLVAIGGTQRACIVRRACRCSRSLVTRLLRCMLFSPFVITCSHVSPSPSSADR